MSPSHKYAKLVDSLYKKTASHSISWQINDEDDRPWVQIGGHIVVLNGRLMNDTDNPLIFVQIYREVGNEVVESFNDESLAGLEPSVEGFESYWPLMCSLFKAAERQAKGIEDAIDDILNILDSDNE